MDFNQLVEKLNKIQSLDEKAVLDEPYGTHSYGDQVRGDEKASSISVLGASNPPRHPFQNRLVGGCAEEEESVEQPIEEDVIAQLAQEFADFLRDKAPILDDILPTAEDHDLGQRSEDRDLIASEDLRDPKDNPCWKGYHPVGTKRKDGREVPNCVPKK